MRKNVRAEIGGRVSQCSCWRVRLRVEGGVWSVVSGHTMKRVNRVGERIRERVRRRVSWHVLDRVSDHVMGRVSVRVEERVST